MQPRRSWTIVEVVNDAITHLQPGNSRIYTIKSGEQITTQSIVQQLEGHPQANGRKFHVDYIDDTQRNIRVTCLRGNGLLDSIQLYGLGVLDTAASVLKRKK